MSPPYIQHGVYAQLHTHRHMYSKIMSHNNFSFLLGYLSQVFCHTRGKLTNTDLYLEKEADWEIMESRIAANPTYPRQLSTT